MLKKIFSSERRNIEVIRLVWVLFFVLILMAILAPDRFFTFNTVSSIGYQLPEFGLYALAMTFAMLLGGIDLSIVAIGNLSGIIASSVMISPVIQKMFGGNTTGVILFAAALGIAAGIVCGVLNGLAVATIGIRPMLATLATMMIFGGISIAVTRGTAIVGLPAEYSSLGKNVVLQYIPFILVIFLAVSAVLALLLNKTRFGLDVYMVGSNEKVARYSGIHSDRVIILAYTVSGILSSIAGLIIVSRSMSAKADYGEIYQLQAILAAVFGGVSPLGGVGKISGVVLSVTVLQILSTGVNFLRIGDSCFIKNLVWGALLLIVMVFTYFSEQRKNRKMVNETRKKVSRKEAI